MKMVDRGDRIRKAARSGEAPNDITWRDGADPEQIADELEKRSGVTWNAGQIELSTLYRDAALLIREAYCEVDHGR